MKRWKKVALVLVLLLLVSQTPFIYRRYRLGRLDAEIATLNSQRAAPPEDGFTDYTGVAHVHSFLGGHSTGTFDEIVRAARSNSLDFVVMTEHPAAHVNTAEATLKGIHEDVLFLNGSEIVAASGERLFVIPGVSADAVTSSASEIITKAKESGRLVFVAYPEQVRDWQALSGYDGVEVYNLYTNSKRINYARLFFDCLWSCQSYSELLFTTFYEKPDENLKRWDETSIRSNRRAVAIAGNDAHSNVGLGLRQLTGEPVFEIKLDPYERSFHIVRNHVIIEKGQPLNSETLLNAFGRGHTFISFDLFCDAGGFRFNAESASERRVMGDEIALPPGAGVRLSVNVPVKSRVVFFRDGQVLYEERETTRKELNVDQRGVYRVEVYLDQLKGFIGERPWIISNPIYVR
jgi:hypothetical protein